MRGQRQFTNQQLRGAGQDSSPARRSTRCPRPSGPRSARSAAGARRADVGARASIDAGRFFATETDVFYGKVIRTDLDLPGVIATVRHRRRWPSGCRPTRRCPAAIEYASHERDLVEVALLRGTLTEADFAQASALVGPAARRRCRTSSATRPPPTFAPARQRPRRGRRTTRSTRYAATCPTCSRAASPTIGGVGRAGSTAANSRIAPMTDAESGARRRHRRRRRRRPSSARSSGRWCWSSARRARPRSGPDARRRRWPAGSPGRCVA